MFWVITLFANGTVLLLFNATLVATVANISLPAPPASVPEVRLDGIPVPALIVNNSLVVPTGGQGVVTVRYVPRLGEADNLLYFNITTSDLFAIWVQRGVIAVPKLRIINYTMLNGDLLIVAKGPGVLAYAKPAPPVATQSAGTPRPTTTQSGGLFPSLTAPSATTSSTSLNNIATTAVTTSTSVPLTQPTTSSPVLSETSTTHQVDHTAQELTPFLLVAVAVAASALGFALYRKARMAPSATQLSEVDSKILAYLHKRGGAYEAQIARELSLPRTTVHRAVRRLAEQGLIKIEKRDGKNWLEPTGSS
ncbi:MAG: helix-turn-helix domain-containing protein [Pyrobaculum sp.]|uniref:helix-turn-helix transcriptional regulator n=1 Tax=Pyrobaculum sp. TaxID=2004705 RepID=UPI003171B447